MTQRPTPADQMFGERDETPTIEVRLKRHGDLVHREWCESEEQAAAVVEQWSDAEEMEVELVDLSGHMGRGEGFEPETVDLREEPEVDRR